MSDYLAEAVEHHKAASKAADKAVRLAEPSAFPTEARRQQSRDLLRQAEVQTGLADIAIRLAAALAEAEGAW
jgi:hypothetical protein